MSASTASRLGVLLVVVLLAGCGGGGEESGTAQPTRPIVLVSGRDDHGLVVTRTVDVSEEPDLARRSRGRIADGTLVAVVDSRGEWIQVRTLEGHTVTGWVNDFSLRGTVHLAGGEPGCPVAASASPGGRVIFRFPPSTQVELLALSREVGRVWVRVRSVETRREAWVVRTAVAELPARATLVRGPKRAPLCDE